VDSIRKKLAMLKDEKQTEAYSMVADEAITYVKEMETQLKARYDALVAGDEDVLNSADLLMLVIDNQDALLAICNDSAALAAYKNITGRYKNMRGCIIVFIDNVNIPYSSPEILKNVRDQRNIMYFDDISNLKIFDAPLAMSRAFKKPIELGDGYYIKENECVKLKTAIR
jgi:S-DNA-T family DNA segregation ATPase FtsK/SpoIIIE